MDKTTTKFTEQNRQPTKKQSNKKVFEHFWKLLFVIVSSIMLVLANKIYLFHTLQEFKNVKKGQFGELVMYVIPCSIIYIILDYGIHELLDDWVDQKFLRQDKYTDVVSRKKKSYTIVRWSYNIIYYSFTSISGYLLIKDTKFMPSFLGGSGSVYSLAENRYLEEATRGMQIYYYVQLGKHVGRYFSHAFIRPEGSYYEYLLHHSLATFLIFFSYTMDMWVIGIFVLIVHDASDVFLALARIYRQYKHRSKLVLDFFYFLAALSWVGLRVVAFTVCCVYSSWYQCLNQQHILTQVQKQVFLLPYFFMTFMLSCLVIMHVYWTYYIAQSFISTSVSQKMARHSYD